MAKTAKQLREEARALLKDAEELTSKELSELKEDLTKKLKPHLDDFVKKIKDLELEDNAQHVYEKFKAFISGIDTPEKPKALPSGKKKTSRRKWTEAEKKEILAYASDEGVAAAHKKYGVAKSQVYQWRKVFETKPSKS